MKKKIIYGFLVGFLFLGSIVFFFALQVGKQSPPPPPTPSVFPAIPTEQVIKNAIENSEVRDEKGNPFQNLDGDYLLAGTGLDAPYQIIYQKNTNFFLISIDGEPFEKVREMAEEKLLLLTKTTPDEACKILQVQITAPFLDSYLQGKIFPLSFCQSPE